MGLCRLAVGGVALVVAVLGTSAAVRAQTQDKNPNIAPKEPAGPQKPVRKVTFVTTTDPVALLAVRLEPEILEMPVVPGVRSSPNGTNDGPADEKAKKTAEIAETERLIQEKQKKVLLLLRLFATDEQMFLRDPSATEKDSSVQERRKYSQDELLWETAELARLKKRMNELEGSR